MLSKHFKGSPTAMEFKEMFGFEWISDDQIQLYIRRQETAIILTKKEFIELMIDGLAWVDDRWDREDRERIMPQ